MALRLLDSPSRFGAVTIVLHWAMAAAIVVLLVLGAAMVRMPDAGYDSAKIDWILLHKGLGMGVFAALALRIAWRWLNPLPGLPDGLPEWQRFAARFVHLCLYGLMAAVPFTGWLMSSAGGYPVTLPGVGELPAVAALNDHLFRIWIVVHRWLAYALGALVVLHAGAALGHHALRRDGSLRRMLWAGETS